MVAPVRCEKNPKKGGAGKKYFSFLHTTLKLFEHMYLTRGRFTVRKLMRFNGVHMQRRDRIHESLGVLIDFGWVRAVPGNPILYEVTDEGLMAYPEAKRVLEFHNSIILRKKFKDTPLRRRLVFKREEVNFIHSVKKFPPNFISCEFKKNLRGERE